MNYRKQLKFLIMLLILFSITVGVFAVEKYNLEIDEFVVYDDFYEIYQEQLKVSGKHKTYETFESIGTLNFDADIKYQMGDNIIDDLWHSQTLSIQHRHVLSKKWKLRIKSELFNDYYYDPLFRSLSFSSAVTLYYYYNLFFYLKFEFEMVNESFYDSNILDNFSKQILFKIMKRQSVMNSYYFMLIAGERYLPHWPISDITSSGNRIDSNVTLVFSSLNSITKKIFNEFSFQLELYNSNVDAYELSSIGGYIFIELPNETSGTRRLVEDYFNYNSRRFTNSTTFILPRNYALQVGLTHLMKQYQKKTARNEYGMLKDSNEWDEQYTLSLNVIKNKIGKKNLSLKFGMMYQVNNSNNKFNQYYLYDGERFMASFGISWKL